tara:strand:- start:11115 stop:11546 length:432 start_codon:yes stop_codon:yes gene_type:complete
MVLEGIAYWASITTPNTRFEPKYTIDVVLDSTTAQELSDKGLNVKFDKEEGPTITVSRKVNGPNGMIRKAPSLMDRNKNQLDCLVGNGSKVKVQAKPWEMTRNGQDFKGLELQAVQVIDLVQYSSGDGDEFDILEDEQEVDEL